MDVSTLNTILGLIGGAFGLRVIDWLKAGWDTRQRARAVKETETDRLKRQLYDWQTYAYRVGALAAKHGATLEELGTPPDV